MSLKPALAAALGLAALAVASPAAAQFQDRTIRFASGTDERHPVAKGIAKMNACLAEKSGGKMKVQGFYGGSLGADLQVTQSLRTGTLEMALSSSSPLIGIVPELGVFDLPFLFADEKEVDALLDGEFGALLSSKLPAVGLVNLAFWENGFRSFANSKHPVARMEDMSGLKVRVMQNNIYVDTFRTLGTNAVPMAGGEVFSALETKAIDGHDNAVVTMDASKLYEVQKYLELTRHTYTPFLIMYSKQLFDALSGPEQAALQDCAKAGGAVERAESRAMTVTSLAKLKQEGMTVTELKPEEIAKMREAVKPVYERQAKTIGPEIVARVQQELAKVRAK